MKKVGLLVLLLVCVRVTAQTVHITPVPVKMVLQKGSFTITNKTVLVLNDEHKKPPQNF